MMILRAWDDVKIQSNILDVCMCPRMFSLQNCMRFCFIHTKVDMTRWNMTRKANYTITSKIGMRKIEAELLR